MKVNLDIPDALYKRLRTQATVRGLKVKDFMVLFMEEGLNQPGNEAEVTIQNIDLDRGLESTKIEW